MATQLITRKGLSERMLCWYSARATSSLPEPDSPRTSTVASVADTRPMDLYTSCMAGLFPMMASPWFLFGEASISTGERMKRPASRACRMVDSIWGMSNGLITWSKAPILVASMAVSVVPKAVMMTTGSFGSIRWICLKASRPFIPGRRTSSNTRSGIASVIIRMPASLDAAVQTE